MRKVENFELQHNTLRTFSANSVFSQFMKGDKFPIIAVFTSKVILTVISFFVFVRSRSENSKSRTLACTET